MSGMDYFSMCIKWFQGRVSTGKTLGYQPLKCLPNLHAFGAVLGAFFLVSAKLKKRLPVLRAFVQVSQRIQKLLCVRGGFVLVWLRYCFATNSIKIMCRVTNKWQQYAAFGCPTQHCVLRGCARRYVSMRVR